MKELAERELRETRSREAGLTDAKEPHFQHFLQKADHDAGGPKRSVARAMRAREEQATALIRHPDKDARANVQRVDLLE
eukprot:7016420-Pyramimonas_sp.AAC.1